MTPIEKAEAALNTRVATIQTHLGTAQSESAQQSLFQALLVCFAIGEALTDYVRSIGEYAQSRHGELKQVQANLTAQHATLLETGNQLLAQFKANPTDKAIRKEIERTKRNMETIQKTLRKGAYALQGEVAPGMALIDKVALTIRRFGEADQIEALKRVIKLMVEHANELYRAQPGLPNRGIIDAPVWEKAALAGIDQAVELQEAYARAGYQVLLALDVMRMALSPTPPKNTEEATARATEAIAARLKATAGRFTSR